MLGCGSRAALGIDTMAEEAGEAATPLPAKKSGAMIGKLVNGIGIFVLSLGAVVIGGTINAKLHPMPDFKLDKDGKITPIVPIVAASAHGEEGAKASLFYPIDPPLVVNFEDGSAVRFLQISMEVMAKDQKGIDSVQKNIPLINRDYQSLMSREGKEKLRQEALVEIRAVQKKQGGDDIEDVLFTSFVVQ
jgi:flagellar FliL protein